MKNMATPQLDVDYVSSAQLVVLVSKAHIPHKPILKPCITYMPNTANGTAVININEEALIRFFFIYL